MPGPPTTLPTLRDCTSRQWAQDGIPFGMKRVSALIISCLWHRQNCVIMKTRLPRSQPRSCAYVESWVLLLLLVFLPPPWGEESTVILTSWMEQLRDFKQYTLGAGVVPRGLSHGLGYLHSLLKCLRSNPGSISYSSFLLMCSLGSNNDGSSAGVPIS